MDRGGNILHLDGDIKGGWREYFEHEREKLGEAQKVEQPVMVIRNTEMKRAISKLKNCKAPAPSEFQIEVVKILDTEGEEWMLVLIRAIFEEEIMPIGWEESLMVSIFKQKGDIMVFGNYRGIKLTEHGLKVSKRVLDERL
ncbi:uncharacterized protein [Palaemon carinicauda]|uniref:uncharacterized protein n=1 Tax=Palaemon carinicauda TaxID=392227 RepID=UPI0035B609C9